jgi:hypothetical protein
MTDFSALEQAVRELRSWLARPDNDFTWSSWTDQHAALAEVDRQLRRLHRNELPDLSMLLVPTGPAQEVSVSSGWAREYLQVAERIESELARIVRDR